MTDYLVAESPLSTRRRWLVTAALAVPAWFVGWRLGWWLAERIKTP